MKKNTFWWLVLIAVVVFGFYYFRSRPGGEAPQPAEETPAAEEEAAEPAEEPAEEEEAGTAEAGAITLTGEVQGVSTVAFTWATDTEPSDEDLFILVRGPEENPVHDGNHYWFRQHGTRRSAVWGSQPSGTFHYRMCIAADEAGSTCGAYSNDVTVNVE